MTTPVVNDFEDYFSQYPTADGYYGKYGGAFVPPAIASAMARVAEKYASLRDSEDWKQELSEAYRKFAFRPTPLYKLSEGLTQRVVAANFPQGTADKINIYLKMEAQTATQSHKANHALGLCLLAKKMGYKEVVCETGAGSYGAALAQFASIFNLKLTIFMGAIDVAKQHSNVMKAKMLGANVVAVETGDKKLNAAIDAAFEHYMKDSDNVLYLIGSVVGPSPFPKLVHDFQTVVSQEIKAQAAKEQLSIDAVVACCGGGSNAMGAFSTFIPTPQVNLFAIEPAGAATLCNGKPSVVHGMSTYNLEDENGVSLPVTTVASGLAYSGCGPEHALLKELGRVQYRAVTDAEVVKAFLELSKAEGIIPALESSHAVAHVFYHLEDVVNQIKTNKYKDLPYPAGLIPRQDGEMNIVINLSGSGVKDCDYVAQYLKDNNIEL